MVLAAGGGYPGGACLPVGLEKQHDQGGIKQERGGHRGHTCPGLSTYRAPKADERQRDQEKGKRQDRNAAHPVQGLWDHSVPAYEVNAAVDEREERRGQCSQER